MYSSPFFQRYGKMSQKTPDRRATPDPGARIKERPEIRGDVSTLCPRRGQIQNPNSEFLIHYSLFRVSTSAPLCVLRGKTNFRREFTAEETEGRGGKMKRGQMWDAQRSKMVVNRTSDQINSSSVSLRDRRKAEDSNLLTRRLRPSLRWSTLKLMRSPNLTPLSFR